MSKAKAEELGLTWLAEIGAHGVVAGPDDELHSQPANAIAKALRQGGLDARRPRPGRDQRGVRRGRHRVRPASSASTEDKVNVNGGAIALGHPIGMSGARLALHLALELQAARRRARRGRAVRRRRSGRRADRCGSRPPDARDRVDAGGRVADVGDAWSDARAPGDRASVARLISLVGGRLAVAAARVEVPRPRWRARTPAGPGWSG